MFLERLEKFLFYLFIFFIPLNIRLFLWQAEEAGSDFNRIFLYATDILIFGFLGLRVFRKIYKTSDEQILKNNFRLSDVFLFIFGFFLFVSFFKNPNIISSFSILKLIELFLVYFYIKSNKPLLNIRTVFWIFIIAALLQVGIADYQFHFQHDAGLKILGEAKLSTDLSGVAEFISNETVLMRSYGTLPHPNILAAILFTAIFIVIYLFLSEIKTADISKLKTILGDRIFKYLLKNSFYTVLIFFLTYGLWLTFSRIGLILFFITIIILFLFLIFKNQTWQKFQSQGSRYQKIKNNIKILDVQEFLKAQLPNSKQKISFLFLIFLIINLSLFLMLNKEILNRFSISPTDQAVGLRGFYNKEAYKIISQNFLLGVGPGNFVSALKNNIKSSDDQKLKTIFSSSDDRNLPDWLYQPVHNIFLLIFAEIGIFSLIAFLLFIFLMLKSVFLGFLHLWSAKSPTLYSVGELKHTLYSVGLQKCILAFIFIGFLIWGLGDHFFWTIEQGRLLFWVVLGLLAHKD